MKLRSTPTAFLIVRSFPTPKASLKTILALIVIALVYMLPGILGHTPWKQDEAYSFGIIQHMVETGQLLVPMNAGQPFMEKPPIYYWTATAFAIIFRHWLPLHDAARLASLFYDIIAIIFVALFAQVSFSGRKILSKKTFIVISLYAGTFGMLKHTHDLFTDVALCAGTAMALYKLQCLVSRLGCPYRNTLWLGLSIGFTALTKGLFIPAIFAATTLLLPLAVRSCRNRYYYGQIILVGLIAFPLAFSWPTVLYFHSKALFSAWFLQNNVGRFVGFSVPHLGAEANHSRVFSSLLFFCFPAGPLALSYIIGGGWRRWRRAEIAVPLFFVTIGIVVLQISATSRALYLLPFIAPLAILGARGLLQWPHHLLRVVNRLQFCLFSLLALWVWGIYFALQSKGPLQFLLKPLGKWLPLDYTVPFKPFAVLFALVLTVSWLLRRYWLPINSSRLTTAQQWLFGQVLVWGLVFTLLLPWLEQAKGYQDVYSRMQKVLSPYWQAGDCLASLNLGESEAPLLYYFTGILHHPLETLQQAHQCRWLLLEAKGKPAPTPAGWLPVWQGSRDGDSQFLQLFQYKSSER